MYAGAKRKTTTVVQHKHTRRMSGTPSVDELGQPERQVRPRKVLHYQKAKGKGKDEGKGNKGKNKGGSKGTRTGMGTGMR